MKCNTISVHYGKAELTVKLTTNQHARPFPLCENTTHFYEIHSGLVFDGKASIKSLAADKKLHSTKKRQLEGLCAPTQHIVVDSEEKVWTVVGILVVPVTSGQRSLKFKQSVNNICPIISLKLCPLSQQSVVKSQNHNSTY